MSRSTRRRVAPRQESLGSTIKYRRRRCDAADQNSSNRQTENWEFPLPTTVAASNRSSMKRSFVFSSDCIRTPHLLGQVSARRSVSASSSDIKAEFGSKAFQALARPSALRYQPSPVGGEQRAHRFRANLLSHGRGQRQLVITIKRNVNLDLQKFCRRTSFRRQGNGRRFHAARSHKQSNLMPADGPHQPNDGTANSLHGPLH